MKKFIVFAIIAIALLTSKRAFATVYFDNTVTQGDGRLVPTVAVPLGTYPANGNLTVHSDSLEHYNFPTGSVTTNVYFQQVYSSTQPDEFCYSGAGGPFTLTGVIRGYSDPTLTSGYDANYDYAIASNLQLSSSVNVTSTANTKWVVIPNITFSNGFPTNRYFYLSIQCSSVGGSPFQQYVGTAATVGGSVTWTTSTIQYNPGAQTSSGHIGICVADSLSDCLGTQSSGSGTGVDASIKFLVPTSTYVGPDPSSWVVNITPQTASTTNYNVNIQYQNGTAVDYTKPVYTDSFSTQLNTTTTLTFTIPKSHSLFDYENNNGTSSQWTALAKLTNDYGVTTTVTTFTITPFATSTHLGTTTQHFSDGTTSTVALNDLAGPFYWNPVQASLNQPTFTPQSLASSSAALFAQCPQPQGLGLDYIGSALSYAACSAINWLFVPPDAAQNYLTDSIKSVQEVPPFSYFFLINNAVSSTVTKTSTFTGSNMIITDNINGHTSSIQLFPADISQNSFLADTSKYGQSVANLWFNLILGAFIAAIVISFYKLVL